MIKTDLSLCGNKGADQLCINCTADQRLCFRYSDSTIPILVKSEILNFYTSLVTAQAGLCQTHLKSLRPVFSRRGSPLSNLMIHLFGFDA